MTLLHPSLLSPIAKFSASEFFETTVRRAIETRHEAATALGGCCVFELEGEDGGTWTVDLDQTTVKRGPVGLPDAMFKSEVEDFARLVERKTSLADLVREKRIEVHGSPHVFEAFAIVLRP